MLFSATRLEGIPRSTPLIHALLLSAGLVMARAFVRMIHAERDAPAAAGEAVAEHIVMIGSNRLTALYMGFLRAYAPERLRVIAVLDDRAEMIGRSIAGVRVLGPSSHLLPVIEEFREHGIHVNRVIVGGDEFYLPPESQSELERVAEEYKMHLEFVPRLIGLHEVDAPTVVRSPKPPASIPASFSPPRYFSAKRYIDFCVSLTLIVVLLPILLAVAIVVLLDVGSPVFFWQRRAGKNGQIFQMHKFRTLKPAFDIHGRPYATTDRMSFIGKALRKSRLDELPQLLNVLVGDMSLIGPRPLLPQDQPHNAALRLSVRPGITGWAQVNGGKLLSPAEKNALDEWYIGNASFWLDLRIVGKTVLFMLSGERPQKKKTARRGTATVHRGQNPRSAARGS